LLVCCALGYGRSAAAVVAWLLASGRAADMDAAIRRVRQVRPRIVLNNDTRDAIGAAATGRAAIP
jgi:protein-tyrosine phosphatase